MKRLILILLIPSVAIAANAIMNSFNSGEISPRLYGRSDAQKFYSSCKVLENMFVWPHGPVEKRRGTYYIADALDEVTRDTITVVDSEYPTLQTLASGDIPTTPSEPADTALVGEVSVTDKAGLAAMTPGNHYSIDNNIDASGAWTPLAWNSASAIVIEGNGNTISNLSLDSTNDIGFIGKWQGAGGGEIRNLYFDSCTVQGDVDVGVLAGEINLTGDFKLSNIRISNSTVTMDNAFAGVLVGNMYIEDANGYVFDCSSTSSNLVTADPTSLGMGGLIGVAQGPLDRDYDLYIVDCNVSGGTLTQTEKQTGGGGGFVGQGSGGNRFGEPTLEIYDSWTSMDLSFTLRAADPQILASSGGFATSLSNARVVSCYSTGDTTITTPTAAPIEATGGFVGLVSLNAILINSYSTGDITVADGGAVVTLEIVGGFVALTQGSSFTAELSGGTFLRCYATGDITFAADVDEVGRTGAFVGQVRASDVNDWSYIERCWSTGDITFSGAAIGVPSSDRYLGAFVGYAAETTSEVTPTCLDCYAWGSIIITNGYTADPTNSTWIGGFSGGHDTDAALTTFENCYCAQTNTAAGSGLSNQLPTGASTRGFGGRRDTAEATSTLFWDTDTSDIATSSIGEGYITGWMQTQGNYESAGWNFSTIWQLVSGSQETTSVTTPIPTAPVRVVSFAAVTGAGRVIEMGDQYFTFYKDVP